MKNSVLASESFSQGNTHYFLDVRVASNQAIYFLLTQSSLLPDGSYKRNSIPVWSNHIHNFVIGFSSLLHSSAYLEQQDVTIHQLRAENQKKLASGIKAMEPSMRPREKLVLNGAGELSNAELLALLIGSGSADESVVELGIILKSWVVWISATFAGLKAWGLPNPRPCSRLLSFPAGCRTIMPFCVPFGSIQVLPDIDGCFIYLFFGGPPVCFMWFKLPGKCIRRSVKISPRPF